ncbi:hypothetical protein [Allosphingosinicella sp.]|uniref:hypothetical protein n=1 Tax=Allosphingosinicella sp. TaxID=2823234 RepID=UPI0037850A71
MRPDLSDPMERAAYQQELRRLMRVPRVLGLLLIVIGTGVVLYARFAGIGGALPPIGWGVIAVGWLNLIAIIWFRTRYHKARMAEEEL